jgi:hypothetical protein
MGLQRYRADEPGPEQKNGAVPWYTRRMDGPTLVLIRNCPIHGVPLGLEFELRNPRTVYVLDKPDSWPFFAAACRYRVFNGKEKVLRGYITTDESGDYYFQAYSTNRVQRDYETGGRLKTKRAPKVRCIDCGESKPTGHMDCQYPGRYSDR